jgi:hypothetical protein
MIRKIQWFFAWQSIMQKLNNINALIAYPMIAELHLNKEKYKERFMKGEKLRNMVLQLLESTTKRAMKAGQFVYLRCIKEERRSLMSDKQRIAFLSRYQKFCNYYRAKHEAEAIDRMMQEAEKDYKKLKQTKT